MNRLEGPVPAFGKNCCPNLKVLAPSPEIPTRQERLSERRGIRRFVVSATSLDCLAYSLSL
jgi:hypothetical protein